MERRNFIQLAAGAAVAWSTAARAQQSKRVLRVGMSAFSPRSLAPFVAFERRMAELGYREGENYTFDYVRTKGPGLADYEAGYREVVVRNPDILFAPATEMNLKAALAASQTTPIVMIAIDYDPFARGYVASLAHPRGRVTGLYLQELELILKRLQLFKDAIPDFDSTIVFFDALSKDQWLAAKDASAQLGLRLSGIDLQVPPFDYDHALAEARREDRKNLFVLNSPRISVDRKRLAEFASRNHLASMFTDRDFAQAGGLMSYGPNINAMFSKAAEIVDRIARGATPGDLPIEQPTKFEFVINLATARTLGLDLPPNILARADEMIE
jgi:putative ABC transport system substrate-binding protein